MGTKNILAINVHRLFTIGFVGLLLLGSTLAYCPCCGHSGHNETKPVQSTLQHQHQLNIENKGTNHTVKVQAELRYTYRYNTTNSTLRSYGRTHYHWKNLSKIHPIARGIIEAVKKDPVKVKLELRKRMRDIKEKARIVVQRARKMIKEQHRITPELRDEIVFLIKEALKVRIAQLIVDVTLYLEGTEYYDKYIEKLNELLEKLDQASVVQLIQIYKEYVKLKIEINRVINKVTVGVLKTLANITTT